MAISQHEFQSERSTLDSAGSHFRGRARSHGNACSPCASEPTRLRTTYVAALILRLASCGPISSSISFGARFHHSVFPQHRAQLVIAQAQQRRGLDLVVAGFGERALDQFDFETGDFHLEVARQLQW